MSHFNEPIPDCVPEYYRSRQGDQEHRYERMMQQQAHFRANQEKINAAAASGLPILDHGGYGPCWECRTADHDTMTDADDDMGCVICLDPACRHHQGNKEESE